MEESRKIGGTKANEDSMNRLAEAAPKVGPLNMTVYCTGKGCERTERIGVTDIRYDAETARLIAEAGWRFDRDGKPYCPDCKSPISK